MGCSDRLDAVPKRLVRRSAGAAVLVGLLLAAGCGESQAPATRYTRVLGASKEGAPVVLGASADAGILQDQTTYQPAKPPVILAGGAAPRAGQPAAAGGDPDARADTVVAALVEALDTGNVDAALKLFNPDHVAALRDEQRAELYPSFEKLELLLKTLEGKVPAELLAGLRTLRPRVELVNPDQASVTPNITVLLFGPRALTPALMLSKQGEQWLFQLSQPLSSEAAAQVVEFHKQFQTVLDRVIDWADQSQTIDPVQLSKILAMAMIGQPVELPEPGGAQDPYAGVPPDEAPPEDENP